ncbi:nitrate/nitrite transporter NrtS [Winogradskyella costae]|uniref:nitrate/nitrite transporter NrtS n=1 Tax=Winogradskyella costae TaxID=2697008 RepID=UPI0015CDC907|nr:nitrate/nitrite transporter NrtS [Winogradskyella costae]
MILKLLKIALEKDIVISSIKVAIVVGCILNIINQGDLLYHLNFENVSWLKLALCFVVPYSVSTYASVKVKTGRN